MGRTRLNLVLLVADEVPLGDHGAVHPEVPVQEVAPLGLALHRLRVQVEGGRGLARGARTRREVPAVIGFAVKVTRREDQFRDVLVGGVRGEGVALRDQASEPTWLETLVARKKSLCAVGMPPLPQKKDIHSRGGGGAQPFSVCVPHPPDGEYFLSVLEYVLHNFALSKFGVPSGIALRERVPQVGNR